MKTKRLWIITWVIIYLAGFKVDCIEVLGNKGFDIIESQYYRFFTGLLVHTNFFHLLINVIVLYCACCFFNEQIGEVKLLIFTIISGFITNIIFSILYPNSVSIGGSLVVFSLIGLIFAIQLLRVDGPRFQFKTKEEYWIMGYAILSNVPIFSNNISTLVIHVIAFCIAFILGIIGIKANII